MKHLKLAAVAALAAFTLASCDDEETFDTPPADIPAGTEGAYVLNQGNSATSPDGSLDFIDFSADTYTAGVFQGANRRMLGSTPQDGVVYGTKLYIVVYGSDLVWVLDRATCKIVKQLAVTEPEGICAAKGAVYVSNNDGHVTKIDTLTCDVAGKIEVGPNPAQMAATGGFLYVSISDGYNWQHNYADGKRVAKIDLATFTKQKDIAVGTNPGPIVADADGRVLVVARGDYATEAPAVYTISPDDEVEEFCPGSDIAVRGTTLYVINYAYVPAGTPLTFSAYDTRTGRVVKEELLPADNKPAFPGAIDVNPANGDIYICADPAGDYGYADYSAPGFVYRYTADGTFVKRYAAGVHPCAVIFR